VMIMVLLFAVSAGGAAVLHFKPELAEKYYDVVGLTDVDKSDEDMATMVLGGLSVLIFFVLAISCCRQRFRDCFSALCCCRSEDGDNRTCCYPSPTGCCSLPFSSRAGTLVCGYSRLETDLI